MNVRRLLLFAGLGFLVIAIIIVIVTLLSRRRQAPTPTPAGQAKLTIWRYSDDETAFKGAIQEFSEENPDVTIEYVKKDLATYENDTLNALASGSGPDIWSIPNDWLARHSDKLKAAPDDLFKRDRADKRTNPEFVKETFVPIVGQEVVMDNRVFGLPLSVDTLALYVNVNQARGVMNEKLRKGETIADAILALQITTWNDFVTLVKTLTDRDGGTLRRSAVAMGSGGNVEVAPDLLAAIMIQNRAQMTDPDNLTATFNLPAKKASGATFNPGLQALDFYASFAQSNKETFSWKSDLLAAQQAFLNNQTLMAFGYSDFQKTIRQLKPDLNVKVLPLPQIAGSRSAVDFASYPVEVVTNNAESPETAWAFVKFLATTGLQDYVISTERPTPLTVVAGPPTIQDRVNFGSPYRFAQQTAQSWNRGKDPEQVETLFRTMIDDVVVRGIGSQQAIDTAAKLITEAMRQAAGFQAKPVEGQ